MDKDTEHLIELLRTNWIAANDKEKGQEHGFDDATIQGVQLGALATTCLVLTGISNNTGIDINELIDAVGLPPAVKGPGLQILVGGILKRS